MSWFLSSSAVPLATLVILSVLAVLASIPLTVWRARDQPLRVAARETGRDLGVAVSLLLIGTLTLAPIPEETPRLPVNLLPFRDQLLALRGEIQLSGALLELGANVILFMPLGIALAWRARWPLPAVGSSALGISVMVESLQAVSASGRQADVTDLLANMAGALLGAIVTRRIDQRGG